MICPFPGILSWYLSNFLSSDWLFWKLLSTIIYYYLLLSFYCFYRYSNPVIIASVTCWSVLSIKRVDYQSKVWLSIKRVEYQYDNASRDKWKLGFIVKILYLKNNLILGMSTFLKKWYEFKYTRIIVSKKTRRNSSIDKNSFCL